MTRAIFFCGGFHWLRVKGKRATSKEASIIAIAPHSSCFDALPVIFVGAPSVVAKGENAFIPFCGSTDVRYDTRRESFNRKIVEFETGVDITNQEDGTTGIYYFEKTHNFVHTH